MNFIKKLIPNNIKQEGKYFLYDLLKIPYNRVNLPVDIMQWLPADKPISFIDIGASKGDFSASLNEYYKVKQGMLIEPIPDMIPVLKARFKDEDKFKVLNFAISNQKGEAEFNLAEELEVMSSLLEIKSEFYDPFLLTNTGRKIKVQTETLDNIVAESKLEEIDLLKIDVQGAEHLVLQSGVNTLRKTRMVFTEFSYRPLYNGSSNFNEVYELLYNNNFRLVNTTPVCYISGELVQANGLFVNKDFLPA